MEGDHCTYLNIATAHKNPVSAPPVSHPPRGAPPVSHHSRGFPHLFTQACLLSTTKNFGWKVPIGKLWYFTTLKSTLGTSLLVGKPIALPDHSASSTSSLGYSTCFSENLKNSTFTLTLLPSPVHRLDSSRSAPAIVCAASEFFQRFVASRTSR